MLIAAVCLTLLAVVVAWSLPKYREHRNELYRSSRSAHPSTQQSTHVRIVGVYDQDADQ